MPKALPIVRPLIRGTATLAEAAHPSAFALIRRYAVITANATGDAGPGT